MAGTVLGSKNIEMDKVKLPFQSSGENTEDETQTRHPVTRHKEQRRSCLRGAFLGSPHAPHCRALQKGGR